MMLRLDHIKDHIKNFVAKNRRLITVLLILAGLLLGFQLLGIREHFTLAFIQSQIKMHPVGGLLLFILMFVLGNLIQIPGWLFLASAVLTLGRVYGGMMTYVAAIISCCVTFLFIRWIGGDALRKLDNKIANKILSRLDAYPVQSVFLLRMLFQTMPAINYMLAMSGIRFYQYLLGTVLGLPLPIMLYCLFFDYLARWLNIAPVS